MYTTAGRRRADCEEELRLNRRTAPQLYLDVLPVFGPAAQARFGRADEPGHRGAGGEHHHGHQHQESGEQRAQAHGSVSLRVVQTQYAARQ